VIRGTLAVVVLAVLLGAGSAAAAEKQAYPVSFHAFALASGTTAGTQLDKGGNGAGNWPFNTAYASYFGLESEVTQLHSLAEAEQFIKAGIPLVASIAFNPGKLDGFFFKSTNGHLMVIVGFTGTGDPIVNDPASPDDATVRHVYDRAQFEDAWMTATGGIVYLIHPSSVALPPSPGGNW